jgi:hypothetical protein
MNPSGAAVDASGMHAATTEAAAVKSAPTTAASTTTGIGVIGDQACGK